MMPSNWIYLYLKRTFGTWIDWCVQCINHDCKVRNIGFRWPEKRGFPLWGPHIKKNWNLGFKILIYQLSNFTFVFFRLLDFFNISDCCNDEVKKVMHVQSISHWAPANIGPYSQVVQVGHFLILIFFNLLLDTHFVIYWFRDGVLQIE